MFCLDYIAAKLHFDSEHFDTEAVKHDKLLVVVLVETAPLATKASYRAFSSLRNPLSSFCSSLSLIDMFKVCFAYREIVFRPICIDLTLVHRHKINGYLLIKT